MDYSKHNAQNVLNNLDAAISMGCSLPMRACYDAFSIFDWWTETLSVSKMKQMRSFIKAAIERGYNGYVCFKVGASGCANGMWAYKKESTDGYSPDGDSLYRSFSPDYTYWAAGVNGKWLPADDKYDSCKTVKQLDALLAA